MHSHLCLSPRSQLARNLAAGLRVHRRLVAGRAVPAPRCALSSCAYGGCGLGARRVHGRGLGRAERPVRVAAAATGPRLVGRARVPPVLASRGAEQAVTRACGGECAGEQGRAAARELLGRGVRARADGRALGPVVRMPLGYCAGFAERCGAAVLIQTPAQVAKWLLDVTDAEYGLRKVHVRRQLGAWKRWQSKGRPSHRCAQAQAEHADRRAQQSGVLRGPLAATSPPSACVSGFCRHDRRYGPRSLHGECSAASSDREGSVPATALLPSCAPLTQSSWPDLYSRAQAAPRRPARAAESSAALQAQSLDLCPCRCCRGSLL
jgi:hypothetical protein